MIQDVDRQSMIHVVPVEMGDYTVYVSASESLSLVTPGSEQDIAARGPSLDSMLGGVAAFAKELAARLRAEDVSKISVEFGCEFALEAGGLVALIGKASATSAIKVGLEWVKPAA